MTHRPFAIVLAAERLIDRVQGNEPSAPIQAAEARTQN